MLEAAAAVEEFVLGLTGSPWILVAVVLLATIDGFFPPVPSESIIIAVAALAVNGEGPSLWLLMAAGAVGAFCGDLIAYTIGTKVPIDRLRVFASPRGQATLSRARHALARRGTVFILSARFVPIGRVAVNMTAGAVGYPRRRFVIIVAFAAVLWGGYSTLLGVGAGVFLHDHPVVAVAVGVTGGVVIGLLVDKLLGFAQRRWFPEMPSPEEQMHLDDEPRGPREAAAPTTGAAAAPTTGPAPATPTTAAAPAAGPTSAASTAATPQAEPAHRCPARGTAPTVRAADGDDGRTGMQAPTPGT